MLRIIIGLLAIVLAGTLDDFVRIYDVSKVADRDGLDLPALAKAIVPHLFQSNLSRPTTGGLKFKVELDGPTLWKCVCSEVADPMHSSEYYSIYYTTEAVTCTHGQAKVVFGNCAAYIDQRDLDQRRRNSVPAKYRLARGRLF